jgi:hypothetical protein
LGEVEAREVIAGKLFVQFPGFGDSVVTHAVLLR